jgi:integrase
MAEGIEIRTAKDGTKSYRAKVWSNRDEKAIRKTFPTMAAAKGWRRDAQVALERGTLRAPKPTTVAEAAEAWLDGAKAGTIRNRSGDPYKPSAIRAYQKSLRRRVLPKFGAVRLADLRRVDVQDFVDEMLADGLAPSTIDQTLNPLRAIYRRAIARGELAVNPVKGLELPAARGCRDRIASPSEAAKLLAALDEGDRPFWATALYAGLRRGELMAIDWTNIDLGTGLIHVERNWDPVEGLIDLKSHAGRRKVPIAGILRDYLDEHRLRSGGEGFVFGGASPVPAQWFVRHAEKAWLNSGLDRITIHECRHSFASMMIAAGVNAKALSSYMGHANISITLDRYGHLMPGNEEEAAGLLDAYLDRADNKAREAALA